MSYRNYKNSLALSIFFCVFGMIFFGLILHAYLKDKDFRASAIETQGIVKDFNWMCRSSMDYKKSQASYSKCHLPSGYDPNEAPSPAWIAYPKVEFTSADGLKFSFSSDIGHYPPAYLIGDKVGVLYLPANPSTAEIKGSTRATMLFALGIVSLIVSLVGALGIWKRARRYI